MPAFAIAYLTRSLRAGRRGDSASHNPYDDTNSFAQATS